MVLEIIPPSTAALIGFATFALFLLLALAVAYAKRDVTINITLFEVHRWR